MSLSVTWVAAAFLSAALFSHTIALRLFLLLCGTGLALAVLSRERDGLRALPAIWLPFALWAGWAALSLAWSLEPERTLKELRNEVGYAGLALWICFIGAQARNAARILVPVAAAAMSAAIAIALRDFSLGWDRYLVGLHGGPGNHSSALLTLVPCVAMTAWYGWRAKWPLPAQIVGWVLAVLCLVSAYFTLNRTIWLGFAAEFSLLGLLLLFRARASRILAATCAVAIVAGCSAAVLTIQLEREAIGAKSFERDPRLALWPQIVDQIEERPLTGYGFGRGLLRGPLREEFGALDPHLWHAHNVFLEALLQLGVPGLMLLLLLLGAIVREAWGFTRHVDDATAACGIALMGVVAGMLVRNMTDTLFVRQNALLFWGVVGVLLALGANAGRPPRAEASLAT